MALIHEETKHPSHGVELMVTERQGSEVRDQWRIVSLSIDSFREELTPRDLRELGRWLIQEGKRIGRAYKSNGAPKSSQPNRG